MHTCISPSRVVADRLSWGLFMIGLAVARVTLANG